MKFGKQKFISAFRISAFYFDFQLLSFVFLIIVVTEKQKCGKQKAEIHLSFFLSSD